MRVHAIETGRVRVKASQLVGRGDGAVVLDDGERRLVFVGDAAYSQDNPLASRFDAISPNAAIARAATARLAAFAAERPTTLLPAHDPSAADRLARGETAPVSVAAAHAA